MKNLFLCLTLLLVPQLTLAQDPPRVLAVIAHPDDEAAFAGTLYAINHHLNGVVDLVLVTDGSGGYRYSMLAEPIYGLKLSDEKVAREYLPSIRRKELLASGKIVGIREYYFLDQHDHHYTTDVKEVREGKIWDIDGTRRQLADIIERGKYDFIFGLVPRPDTHAHHSTATMLALEARRAVPKDKRPIALGVTVVAPGRVSKPADLSLKDYPITSIEDSKPIAEFDRTRTFGPKKKLNYKIIVDWVIAAHKSQGTMQLFAGKGEQEQFWYFKSNPEGGREKTISLFEKLEHSLYK